MCDTAVVFCQSEGSRESLFGKNSDREAAERQVLEVSLDPKLEFTEQPYIELHDGYVQHNLPVLREAFTQFAHPYWAVISRPVWMWGAEMGVNQHGVAIGNEAVFSEEPVPVDGLLGMDILRLTLHNATSAAEGVEFAAQLLEVFGQGGSGGYRKPLYYHNSFMIKDATEAYIMETVGRRWVARRVTTAAAISNAYSITDDYHLADPKTEGIFSFKDRYEDPAATAAAHGEERHGFSNRFLAEQGASLTAMRQLLRSHGAGGSPDRPADDALCMHRTLKTRSETTASLVVHWTPGGTVLWFTGSPRPCVSLFKPMALRAAGGTPFLDDQFALEYAAKMWTRQTTLGKGRAKLSVAAQSRRQALEAEFEKRLYNRLGEKTAQELNAEFREFLELEEQFAADYLAARRTE